MPAHVLVVHGTTNESTAAEIAQTVADVLGRGNGLTAEAGPAEGVPTVTPYGAAVIGGALYAGRRHKDTRRFVHRHREELAARPLWFFSSGPLDVLASALTPGSTSPSAAVCGRTRTAGSPA